MSYGVRGNGSGKAFRAKVTIIDTATGVGVRDQYGRPENDPSWPVLRGPYVDKGAAKAAVTVMLKEWRRTGADVVAQFEIQEASAWTPIK